MLVYKPLKYRQSANAPMVSLYHDEEMGKWYWVYLMGQTFAAPLAGYISGRLLSELNSAYDKTGQRGSSSINNFDDKEDYDDNYEIDDNLSSLMNRNKAEFYKSDIMSCGENKQPELVHMGTNNDD